jgi:cell division protein FtsW (lipid II flippase)
MPEVFKRGDSMLILVGWIFISVVILAFVGFMLTVSANWIFNAPKDGKPHETAKPFLRKN